MSQKKIIKSACRMCHGVCQVLVHVEGDRVVKITGDKDSPTSRGYICNKGKASVELLYHPDRILSPMRRKGKRGENKWEKISWDEALEEMSGEFTKIKEESGSEYVGLTQGTGRPYENIYNRFAAAFGTPNFTAPAHLCYLPRIMVNITTMGFPLLPICDVYGQGGELPKCVVIWGCNITGKMGHHSADGMCGGMLQRAINKAEKVIVIDPRRISPARNADHWLQIRPGTDGALALAMINVIINEDLVNNDFVDKYTHGFQKLKDHVRGYTPEWAEKITRINSQDIKSAARTYAQTKPACIQWGNAIDQSACNFQTSRSILILRALTGNLDKPGGDFFPTLPDRINHKTVFVDPAFAGNFLPQEKRELRIANGKYRLLPTVPQYEFWRSIVSGDPYRMRAVWIMGSNPLVTVTHSAEVEKALNLLEYIVVSDMFLTPTAQYADLFLPASTWLEYDEIHTSAGHTYSLLARKKVTQVGDTKDDQEVIIQLARRLGLYEAFPWKNHRELNEWVLENIDLSFDEFLEKGILLEKQRYYKYMEPGFFKTPSGKFEIESSLCASLNASPLPVYREPSLTPLSAPETAKEYPLILTTGAKIGNFFHSEGRQIQSLRKANIDPQLEIHPKTAENLGISENDWVWIETIEGRIKMRARFFDGIAQDVVSAQHAWWYPEDDPPEYGWKKSSINLIIGDMAYDPDTGSASLRSILCKVYKAEN